MNDLKRLVTEHLDDAVPDDSAARVDHDVAVLWRARGGGRFGVAALVGACVVGAVLYGVASAAFVHVVALVGRVAPDDDARFVVRRGGAAVVDLRGTLAVQAALLDASHTLGDAGSRVQSFGTIASPPFSVLAQLAEQGDVSFAADACVNDGLVDVKGSNVPLQVALDRLAAGLGWVVTPRGADDVVTVRCAGHPDGPLTRIDARHPWPAESPALDATVHLDVVDAPLDVVVTDLARQTGLTPRASTTAVFPHVSVRLNDVSLRTALLVLRESSRRAIGVDGDKLTIMTRDLPEVQAIFDTLDADQRRDQAEAEAIRSQQH